MLGRLAPLVLLAAVLVAAGCGGGQVDTGDQKTADLTQGKQLFISGCGSCHTLADAGTTATVGPNLDDAFGYDREQCFDVSTFFDVTLAQIAIPNREGAMPAHIYTGQNAVNVAGYVAAVAGQDRPCPTAG
jgi:mono/diheme cytochrome c family protein